MYQFKKWAQGASLALALLSSPVWAQTAAPIKLGLIEGLSGAFANTGESVFRNLQYAVERINARGGVKLPSGAAPLELVRYDSQGKSDEALLMLKAAQAEGVRFVLQGNSSAVALALLDAINKNNEREPTKQMLLLNYSAVDPILTNEKCSFWHFRFDAHADMRMVALMDILRSDKSLQSVYLIGQDYSFGQAVLREGKRQLGLQRPDVKIVGEELHPIGQVKDFAPYVSKIVASGASAVLTGNWGNDLTLLIKAAKEAGYKGKFYTFYGNALGAPAAIGDAGLGKVVAVADWLPNAAGKESTAYYQDFKKRFPNPQDDYMYLRMHVMLDYLVRAIEKSKSFDAKAVAYAMEGTSSKLLDRSVTMRKSDHQLQQPLVVGLMEKAGTPAVRFDVEGSGYGFEVIKTLTAKEAEMPSTCNMTRP